MKRIKIFIKALRLFIFKFVKQGTSVHEIPFYQHSQNENWEIMYSPEVTVGLAASIIAPLLAVLSM